MVEWQSPVRLAPIALLAAILLNLWLDRRRRRAAAAKATGSASPRFHSDLDVDQAEGLALTIRGVHENVEPIDVAPWFRPGGDWLFLDCHVADDESAAMSIGIGPGPALPGAPFAFGRAVLAPVSREAGRAVVAKWAPAFQTAAPAEHEARSLRPLTFDIAFLGNPAQPGTGKTKWFLTSDATGEAEVYFHFDTAKRRAVFSPKDAAYAEDLLAIVAATLRDGPPPERTPANDPRLTDVGPRFVEWRELAIERATVVALAGDGSGVFAGVRTGESSVLHWFPLVGDASASDLLTVDGTIADVVPAADGRSALVRSVTPGEIARLIPGAVGSDDPARVWFVDATGAARALEGPWDRTALSIGEAALSPDGRLAVVQRSTGSRKTGDRQRLMHFVDTESGALTTLEGAERFMHVGWWGSGGGLRARLATGWNWLGGSEALYDCDPTTGALERVADVAYAPSPNGRRAIRSASRGCFEIVDLASGDVRRFDAHPDDARFVATGNLAWVSDRYLAFATPRFAFLDADELRMSYPEPRGAIEGPPRFDSRFGVVLAKRAGRWHAGRVTVP